MSLHSAVVLCIRTRWAVDCLDAFMRQFLTICCPEQHTSAHCLIGPSLHKSCGITQHAAPESMVASIFSKHSIVLKCRRCFSTLSVCCAHPLPTFDPSRCLNSVNPSRCVLTSFSNCSNVQQTRHDVLHDFFELLQLFQFSTGHDLRHEFHNCHSTRRAVVGEFPLHGLSHAKLLDLGIVDNFRS